MDVDTNRSSQWINCATETGYICLNCQKPVCNKSRQCSVSANGDTPGWKAGVSVAYYVACSGSVTASNTASIFMNKADKRGTFLKVHPKRKISSSPHTSTKRKCLALSEKVDVIKTANRESIGTRKLAEMFECGKTQVVTTLQNKDEILAMWNSNEGAETQRRLRTGKYSEINHLLWEWYNRVRESNAPISGNFLIEEARLIAERLWDETFQGSNGWLEK